MKTCKDCIHFEVCKDVDNVFPRCEYFKDKSKFIELPVPIGTDLYRIDSRYFPCGLGRVERDEYVCQYVLGCFCTSKECDCKEEYYIFKMKNANAMTILGNQEYLGSLVFTSKEEAEKRIKELNDNIVENTSSV